MFLSQQETRYGKGNNILHGVVHIRTYDKFMESF